MIDVSNIKYEYGFVGGIPSAVLKPGKGGVISVVSFYRDHIYGGRDHLRGRNGKDDINIGMALKFVQDVLEPVSEYHPPRTLEECTDTHLEALSRQSLAGNGMLPLEELTQLRELERYLRATIGDYR